MTEAYIEKIGGDIKGIIGNVQGGVVYQYIIARKSEAEIHSQKLIPGSPYLGLKKFEPEDKDKFFGREQWIQQLSHHLASNNLLLLLGASGSGKSSLIQAGIIPYLGDKWGAARLVKLIFVPHIAPLDSLVYSLPHQSRTRAREIIERETNNPLIPLIQELKEDNQQWIIFMDQFEEIFTLTPQLQRDQFINNLELLIRAKHLPVKLIIAMRSDFIDRLRAYPNFIHEVEQSRIRLIKDLSESELRLAIAEPAARNGVTFAKGLVEQIISDFHQQAGSLPLLQYTLNLLWEKDRIGEYNRVFQPQTYTDLGGVSGALQQQADYIYNTKLNDEEKEAAKQIFIQLIDLAVKEPVSRRVQQAQLRNDPVQATALDKLIDYRLLTSGREAENPNNEDNRENINKKNTNTVEVAHEQLLRSWTLLQDLIREQEEIIILRGRLIGDASQWHGLRTKDKEKAKDELWSGSKLERVLELRKAKAFGSLDDSSEEFIQASVERRDYLRLEKTRRQRRTIQLLSGSLVVVLGAAMVAVWQWRNAQRQATIVEVRADAVTVRNLLTIEPVDALVLAISNAGKSQDKLGRVLPQAQSGLYDAIDVARERNLLKGHQGSVFSVGFSPDGQYIVGGSFDKTVRLWDRSGKPIGKPFRGHEDSVGSVAFSPDGQYIVSGSSDKTVRLWDSSGKPIGEPFRGHESFVNSVGFSPDGQYIVSGSRDNTVRLWDRSGKPIGEPFRGHESSVSSVGFSPDGQYIVSGSEDNTIRLWDRSGKPIGEPFLGHQSGVSSVGFSPNGQYIVSGSWDNTIRLWDRSGKLIGEPFLGHEDSVLSVGFSPDGQYIVSGSNDGTVRLWRGGNWQSWLSVACDRLRFHPVLLEAETQTAKSAGNTCLNHGNWSESEKTQFLVKQALARGRKLAVLGKIEEAIASFKKARRLNSDIDLNPETKVIDKDVQIVAQNLAASAKVEQGIISAENGKIQKAISLFQEAKQLNPEIDLNPETEPIDLDPQIVAQNLAASAKVKQGIISAENGKIQKALSIFQEAKQLDPKIDLNPETELIDLDPQIVAQNLAASAKVEQGIISAENGKIQQALSLFQEAKQLNPKIDLNPRNPQTVDRHPKIVAKQVAAFYKVEEGIISAANGKIQQAIILFQEAKQLNPKIDINPRNSQTVDTDLEIFAKKLAARYKVQEGIKSTENGKIEEAIALYKEAEKLDQNAISAESWNVLCWFGSLEGNASDVIFACEKAVQLAPEN